MTDKLLWHYTDAAGLEGIIKSGKVRLGDARFLNDRTERQYAFDIIAEILERETKKGDDFALLQRTMSVLGEPRTDWLFVASFSENHDSISQWQRYGGGGAGYCVAFALNAMTPSELNSQGLKLLRLVYGLRAQRQIIRDKIALILKRYVREIKSRPPQKRAGALDISTVLAALELEEIALTLKHPSFRDEREWRLVREVPNRQAFGRLSVDFVRRGDLLKPFIDISLPFRTDMALPIYKVICGPKLDGPLAVSATEAFLSSRGYVESKVSWSALNRVWR